MDSDGFSHTVTGSTPHSRPDRQVSISDPAANGISRQPTTNLNNPLSRVSTSARQFLRPDGTIVHVARSPDEERQIRRRLTRQSTLAVVNEKDYESNMNDTTAASDKHAKGWDIVISGSDEHVSINMMICLGSRLIKSRWKHSDNPTFKLKNYELNSKPNMVRITNRSRWSSAILTVFNENFTYITFALFWATN
jgi:hypothetical protein